METLALRLFLVVWVATMIYLGMVFTVGLRLNKHRKSGRAPADTPDVFHTLQSVAFLGYLFRGDYRALDDPLVSRLIPIIRVWFIALIPAMAAVFVMIWLAPAQPFTD